VRLREALRDNRLKLFAQPMRPVRDTERPVRLELLPRILDERGTLIAPVEFLSTGSDRDALTELDRWVMSAALTAIAARSSSPASRGIEVSLNISPRSLEVADFHDWIAEQLRRGNHGREPRARCRPVRQARVARRCAHRDRQRRWRCLRPPAGTRCKLDQDGWRTA
jgi:EAL domain-containing protein (putative c-di-GMP-specific phosphodiesterase class I)